LMKKALETARGFLLAMVKNIFPIKNHCKY